MPVGLIYNIKDMLEDPHYQSRDLFEEVEVDGSSTKDTGNTPQTEQNAGAYKSPWATSRELKR